MNAAKLDRRIQLYQSIQTQNSWGETIYVDSLVDTLYAKVLPVGGRETFFAAQMVPEAVFRITIRYRSDLDTTYKIGFDSKMYDIAYVAEIGRREGLDLLVKFP